MPRKYRPPAAKRRKAKKTGVYTYEAAPEPEVDEDTEVAAASDELDEEEWAGAAQSSVAVAESRQKGREPARHLVKDYSYVRGEVVRILGLASFLIVSLLITAVLRN